ncbi:MAG: hypothetical protein KatS3mg076_2237 [Candidatus Binatia bacterium]|nr:MAG: hypothetical protein KatS3mg076_2237 [Candidatus Binatia bacterium]
MSDTPGTERVRVADSVLAAEEALLRAIEARLASREASVPIRVVVPSRSLRLHVGDVLVRRFGGALVGVRVQTLFGLACEILERAGVSWTPADMLFPSLVSREASFEGALSGSVLRFRDGYLGVAASVADFLDAGMEAEHGPALEDALSEEEDREVRERGRALVRTAARVASRLRSLGLDRRADVLRKAREVLLREGPDFLRARGLFVHGFSDATGVAADLLETLLRRDDAFFFVDDPLGGEAGEPSYVSRFVERLGLVPPARRRAASPPGAGVHADTERGHDGAWPSGEPPEGRAPSRPARRLRLLRAPDVAAEVREVGERILRALEEGVVPEEIGVVARDFSRYRTALRAHLDRLGIPFSTLGLSGPASWTTHRALAFLDCLTDGSEAQLDRWLELFSPDEEFRGVRRFELALALRRLGLSRLGDVHAVDAERLGSEVVLPVSLGFEVRERDGPVREGGKEPEGPARTVTVRRAALPRSVVLSFFEDIRRFVAFLGTWPGEAPVEEHERRLRVALGYLPRKAQAELGSLLGDAVPEKARGLSLAREEFFWLLREVLSDHERSPFGGKGSGVQVLDVTEARGRTFSVLFVLGCSRDVFPRVVREDPLLPDAVRARLRSVLPDLPIKALGFDEERHLFWHLLSASPEVTVSWPARGHDDEPLAPSPFVEALREDEGVVVERAPALYGEGFLPRSAFEQAVLRALREGSNIDAEVLGLAQREVDARHGHEAGSSFSARDLASARVAVLRELDADELRPGPYSGFVGPVVEPADPRRNDPYVTTIERFVRCPWQTFVERLLRVEPPVVPSLGAGRRVLGSIVHRALQGIVRRETGAGSKVLAEVENRAPVLVRWPEPGELESLLREAVEGVLAEEGLPVSTLAPVVVEEARRYLELARAADWAGGGPWVLAAEVDGFVDVGGRRIGFRVDRVDRSGEKLLLTDYKTSSESGRTETQVRKGKWLQLAAYAYRASGSREGRFLLLDPRRTDFPKDVRESGRPEVDDAFREVVGIALAAWEEGWFFPRLLDQKGSEPRGCLTCGVAEACLRGDPVATERLGGWLREEEAVSSRGELAARRVWRAGWK